jgi:hypothetical protein
MSCNGIGERCVDGFGFDIVKIQIQIVINPNRVYQSIKISIIIKTNNIIVY